MADIHRISDKITLPGEPFGDLVTDLERLLADAKSGELRALAYAAIRKNEEIGTGWTGDHGTRNPLGLGILLLHHRYAEAVIEAAAGA